MTDLLDFPPALAATQPRALTPAMPSLASVDITALKGVGAQLASKLTKLSIASVQDLLFHLPMRYMDRTRVTPIGAIQPMSNVVVEAEVKASSVVFGRRRSLMCRVQDGSGTLTLRFFHFSAAQKKNLAEGVRIRCFGEARRGASGLEIYHPEYEFLDGAKDLALDARLTPVYPVCEGITQQRLRGLTEQALALVSSHSIEELLPQGYRSQAISEPVSLQQALVYLHRPPADAPIDLLLDGEHPFQQRLAFEELLAHHLSMLKLREVWRATPSLPLPVPKLLIDKFMHQLSFGLTAAQQRVAQEIAADLSQPMPMLRLVQGDVGSGKTVVAALAALQAVGNGRQVAIMAPTEILAEQHRVSFSDWFEPLGIQVGWLTGKQKVAERRSQAAAIASGEVQVVVGTHALFQQDVEFADLAFTIIDEQHRFGVHQRLALREKGDKNGVRSHQLIMTATPIPRTLAMSAYADLDISIIDELPPGRTPVVTVAITQERRLEVVERVRNACQLGRQAYWVCTLIEESEVLEAQAAEAVAEALKSSLIDLRIALIHGRMKSSEKEQVMQAFKAGDIHLLVATTVIEVGVDVANASLMIIENPERLGLAQLHQLRGRVGRGRAESHCVLLYGSPLSEYSKERLKAMRETSDGFVIAEKDLELRGPGEVLGTRQTGEMHFKLANLQRDGALLPEVKQLASHFVTAYPQETDALILRWLAGSENYASV